jgi:hypothetical protein
VVVPAFDRGVLITRDHVPAVRLTDRLVDQVADALAVAVGLGMGPWLAAQVGREEIKSVVAEDDLAGHGNRPVPHPTLRSRLVELVQELPMLVRRIQV